MIERKFVAERIKEFQVQSFVRDSLKNAGVSHTKMQRTPLGEKIVITAARPGLVVGRGGENIRQMTKVLKRRFNLENPQIEINEVQNINLDAKIMAEKITSSLERFGSSKFKGIAHKVMTDVMNAGAAGIELRISGKIPSARAKCWRFFTGHLKKCGDIALTGVDTAFSTAKLKSGIIGVRVKIMRRDTRLPDDVRLLDETEEKTKEQEKISQSDKEEKKKAKREPKKKGEKKTEGKKKKEEANGVER